MGGVCEFFPTEGPWQVHAAAEVWFARLDPNHCSQLAPFIIVSLAPLWGVPASSFGSRSAPSAVILPLVMASTAGGIISWRMGRGCGCATISNLPCGLRFNTASRVKT